MKTSGDRWPLGSQVAPGRTFVNPMASMPREQFGIRSIDRLPNAPASSGGGGGFDGDWPLKLVKVDDGNVKVLLGTVSGFTPTDVETNIDVSGSDGTWAIYMYATISGTAVTSASVQSDSSGTVPTDDGNNSYRLIGEVDVASGVITAVRASMAWSQSVVTCTADSAPHVWQTGA